MSDEECSQQMLQIHPARSRVAHRRNGVVDVENPCSFKSKVGFGSAPTISSNSRHVLLERNTPCGQNNVPQRHDDGLQANCFPTFSSASSVHNGTGSMKDFGSTMPCLQAPNQSSSIQSHRNMPYSDSVVCDELDLDGMGTFGPLHDQTSLAWDSNKPLTANPSFAPREDNYLVDESNIYSESAQDNESEMAASSNESGSQDECMAGMRQVTPPNRIEEIRNNVNELEGGDAIFQVQLDLVIEKLVYALTDLDSAYLFRDFAGHFTEFLDRFGPGGYDIHRAPPKANWILNLVLPLIHADADSSDMHVRVYAEVSGWFQRMVGVLGWHNADVLFAKRGGWERCVEHMSSSRAEISDVAFETAETVLRNVPLEYRLISIVNRMKPFDLGSNDTDLCRFRLYRVKLFSVLLERVDNERRAGNEEHCKHFVPEIARHLETLKATEADLRISKSIDVCLKYARDTEALFTHHSPDQLSPRTRRPRLSLTFSRWQQQQMVDQQDESDSRPKSSFFSRLFHRRSKAAQDLAASNVSTATSLRSADNRDAMSVQTSRSTRTLRQRWRKLFGDRKSSPESDDAKDEDSVYDEVDMRTVITV